MTDLDPLERSLATGLARLASDTQPPDIHRVLERATRTRQRRHAFLRPLSVPPADALDSAAARPTRRSFAMSTIRYGTVAMLALVAGLTLPALLADPSPAPTVEAARVSGTIGYSDFCDDPQTSIVKGVGMHYRDYTCTPQPWTSSDARFTGVGSTTWNSDLYPGAEGGSAAINQASMTIETDGGTWHCASSPMPGERYTIAGGQPLPTLNQCTGSGGYEGLVAVIRIDDNAGAPTPATFDGVVLRGQLPPAP